MIVTNYKGEVIPWDKSEKLALDVGHNVNCKNCTNCRSCTNCENCTDCSRCTNCKYCIECGECTDCSYCKQCTRCVKCLHCLVSARSKDCDNCTNCVNCEHCTCCNNCTYCTCCNNCTCCTKCDLQPNLFIVNKLWYICLRDNHTLKIGCQDYPVSDWLSFTDQEISEMHHSALSFWKQWKPTIIAFYAN